MKYEELQIGDWFERDGYKYIKTVSPDGYPNMRLTPNENRNQFFAYRGIYFPQDDQVNFLTSWEYTSPDTERLAGMIYKAKTAPYNLLLEYYGKNLFLIKKTCNREDMFLVIYSDEPFFEAGHWYALQDDIKLIYIDHEDFEYNEFEKI